MHVVSTLQGKNCESTSPNLQSYLNKIILQEDVQIMLDGGGDSGQDRDQQNRFYTF